MSSRAHFLELFSQCEGIIPFGHPLHLPLEQKSCKSWEKKSRSRLESSFNTFLRANRRDDCLPREISSLRNDSPGDDPLFFAGFTAGGGGDADKVRCGANTRAKVAQFRDQEAGRADASTRSGYGRSGGSMDDGHQGGH